MFVVDRKDVFCFCLKVFYDRLLSRGADDKLFHSAGPQKAKLRCPIDICASNSWMNLIDAERSDEYSDAQSSSSNAEAIAVRTHLHVGRRK